MKAKPIPLKTWEVQAILDGRKTQTRRVVKGDPDMTDLIRITSVPSGCFEDMAGKPIKCPYGQPGDVLWVRETWAPALNDYAYKADYSNAVLAEPRNKGIWKPSIHMPREAARLFLRIKSVRVERLTEISEEDALAEGIGRIKVPHRNYELVYRDYLHHGVFFPVPLPSFTSLWQSINGPESWEANPWVWVVEFERITREGGEG
jgi:hypothetical protein